MDVVGSSTPVHAGADFGSEGFLFREAASYVPLLNPICENNCSQ